MSEEKDLELNGGEDEAVTPEVNESEAIAEEVLEEAAEEITEADAEVEEAVETEEVPEEAAEETVEESADDDILVDNTDGEAAEEENTEVKWGEAEVAALTEKKPMGNGAKAAIIAVAAVLVVVLAVIAFIPQILPFNCTFAKFTDTDEDVWVQSELLKGEDDQVFYLGGKTYISVSGLSKALEYNEVEGTSVKLKVNDKDVKIGRNVKRVNGNRLSSRVFVNNGELFIAYDDVTKAFPNLKSAKLSSKQISAEGYSVERKCVYDPVPYLKAGQTLKEMYEMYAGMGVVADEATFRTEMGIPEDVDLETDINIFQNEMTLGQIAAASEKDFETYKAELIEQDLGVDESMFTEDTTVGEVQDAMPLEKAFGSADVTPLIEEYGLSKENIGIELKADTPFKEIRNLIMIVQQDMRQQAQEEAEKQADESEPEAQLEEEAPAEGEAPAEDAVVTETTEAPADAAVSEAPAAE